MEGPKGRVFTEFLENILVKRTSTLLTITLTKKVKSRDSSTSYIKQKNEPTEVGAKERGCDQNLLVSMNSSF